MSTVGGVALSGDAQLTVSAGIVPAQPVWQWWDWFHVYPPVWVDGLTTTHVSNGDAALTVTRYSGVSQHGAALGSGRLVVTAAGAGAGNTKLNGVAVLGITVPVFPDTVPNELTYFPVSGTWYDVESPDTSGDTNQVLYQIISGYVTFYPRVPVGFAALIENLDDGSGVGVDTSVSFAPVGVRIMHGRLSTINRDDTPGVQLLANSALVSKALLTIDPEWLKENNLAAGQLVYDVRFSEVVFASAAGVVSNFAFVASVDGTEICLTDPGIARLSYGGPAR